MRLAENINTYLTEQGIKKKYVAEKSDISENALNLALNGKRRLLADEYIRICKTLDVPFDRFVTTENDRKAG